MDEVKDRVARWLAAVLAVMVLPVVGALAIRLQLDAVVKYHGHSYGTAEDKPCGVGNRRDVGGDTARCGRRGARASEAVLGGTSSRGGGQPRGCGVTRRLPERSWPDRCQPEASQSVAC